MNVIVLNGTRKSDSSLELPRKILIDELKVPGWQVDEVILSDTDIGPCNGCFGCWTRTPGKCVVGDGANDLIRRVINCDLEVLFTPVTFGGYSSELKKALDRHIPLILPYFRIVDGEVHHKKRYDRYPLLMAVGVLPEPDNESELIFNSLVNRNAKNFFPPSHTQGIIYTDDSTESIRNKINTMINEVKSEV